MLNNKKIMSQLIAEKLVRLVEISVIIFCRGHVAMLLGSATGVFLQAVSTTFKYICLPSAWGWHKALANAAGFFRLALSAENDFLGFSKPMRCLTEHITIIYSGSFIMETEAKITTQSQ